MRPGPAGRPADAGARAAASCHQRITDRCAGRSPFGFIVEPNAAALRRWAMRDDVSGLLSYVDLLSRGVGESAALFKLQSAAFERFGPAGWEAMIIASQRLRESGAPVVLDTKRIDHAPVLDLLLGTYVGPGSVYALDGITVAPYFGPGDFRALADSARARAGIVLVIARTSVAGSDLVQEAQCRGIAVADLIADEVKRCNRDAPALGLVLGGTHPGVRKTVSAGSAVFVLPGWGRPGCQYAEIARTAAATTEPVVLTIGSRITQEPPDAAALRQFANRQLSLLRSLTAAPSRREGDTDDQ